jgi:serine/threonine-protein kinase
VTAQNSEATKRVLENQNTAGRDDTEPAADAVVWVGRVLAGKYRIDGELGRGGMGVVMSGHQLNLDRRVAIKFLRGTLASQARSSQRFAREAMAVAKIESEHVARVFDAGEEGGVPYIVMEHLEGHDLAAELAGGPLPASLALEYLRQACEPIIEAHALGIVHRDLKPSNLFLAKSKGKQSLKVLDFGVSKWLGPVPGGDTPFATREDSLIGTPAYVSPEQLVDPQSVDGRTDVWALGVVLYQCLTGKLPFQAESVPRLTAAILSAEPAEFDPSGRVPEGLREITLRCLKKDPAERFQTVEELDRALLEFSEQGGPAKVPVATIPLRSARPVVIGAVVLVLGAGFAVARWGISPEESETSREPEARVPVHSSPASELAAPSSEPGLAELPRPARPGSGLDAADEKPSVASEPVASPAPLPTRTQAAPVRGPRAVPGGSARATPAVPAASGAAETATAPASSASVAPVVKERLYRH